jgi:hypothetical protein
MRPSLKIAIGLLLALAAGWASHAPLGQGEALVADLEARSRAAVATAGLPGIEVRLSRRPLARAATLSGPANDLQREGLGSQKGLSDLVREVEGIGPVRWADEPAAERRIMPLLGETLILAALSYLTGLGLGWLFWGRRRRERFAD